MREQAAPATPIPVSMPDRAGASSPARAAGEGGEGAPIHIQARRVLALAMRAGDLMLRSGAETSRVEETVNILVRGFDLAQSQCLVTPTGIYLSIDDPRLAQ